MGESSLDLLEPANTTDHQLGAEHAPIVVVEYGDFECPNCKQAAPAVQMLLGHFPNRVRFVYRHFPQEEAHPHALGAAEAAECAGAQGKFWQMHDLLFAHQTHLERKDLDQYAEQVGLDMARFKAEMDDEIFRQRIREHFESGRRSGVRATPGFFVNGRILDVSFGLHILIEASATVLRSLENAEPGPGASEPVGP